MDPETHANMIRQYPKVFFLIAIPLICLVSIFWSAGWGSFVAFLVFGATMALIYYILWHRPVRCQTPGCSGLMEKTLTQISGMKAELRYRCPICNNFYVCEIFSVDQGSPP
jgi:hypothetical protein